MPSAIFQFPQSFLFGSSTSAWQVEGGIVLNNWSNWNTTENGQRGNACGWWDRGRWREDLDHAAEDSQKIIRISLEWARIQPGQEQWDEDTLDRYREILRGAVSRGLQPIVTLHHFTDPVWFTQMGGWENKNAPDLFCTYAERVMNTLKPLNNNWITINEPGIYAINSYINGVFPPGRKNAFHQAFTVLSNMATAHAAVYTLFHAEQADASVGITVAYRGLSPHSSSPFDKLLTLYLQNIYNDSFPNVIKHGRLNFAFRSTSIPEVKDKIDFIGLNYYTSYEVHFRPGRSSLGHAMGSRLGDSSDIADEPEGFFQALLWAKSFGKPIIITANGIDDAQDQIRPDYLAGHIHQLWKAWSAGIPVIAYLHWSLTDSFEWEHAWTRRFGLWELDPTTGSRTKRESANLYALICKKKALDMQDVKKYAPCFWKRIFIDEPL